MKIIGLTGLYCAGKSSAAEILKTNHNFLIIDVDKIGHKTLEEKKAEIIKTFGKKIVTNNKIDRKILGNIVFNNKKALETLNSILHPEMIKKIKKIITDSKNQKICINAALLYQMGLDSLCSSILIIKASLPITIIRAKRRDKNPILKILKIIFIQKKEMKLKTKNKNADILYVNNNGNLKKLKQAIQKLAL